MPGSRRRIIYCHIAGFKIFIATALDRQRFRRSCLDRAKATGRRKVYGGGASGALGSEPLTSTEPQGNGFSNGWIGSGRAYRGRTPRGSDFISSTTPGVS